MIKQHTNNDVCQLPNEDKKTENEVHDKNILKQPKSKIIEFEF